jgi:hypothetical protein
MTYVPFVWQTDTAAKALGRTPRTYADWLARNRPDLPSP